MREKTGATGILLTLAVGAAALLGAWLEVFEPIDDALVEMRFGAANRPVTGDIVFVDVDSRSLREIGVWPWPRSVYAEVLEHLGEWGSAEVAFDIDFPSRSSESGDSRFTEALEAAGGYAMLAAFQQVSGITGENEINLPLARFLVHAPAVVVNVIAEKGVIRSFPRHLQLGDEVYPSLAAALAGQIDTPQAIVHLDYGIDPRTADRIAFIDVLRGEVDPARIENRQVIIGASALELRDIFSVPRFGTLPGPLVQLLAAETLKQGRELRSLGSTPAVAAALVLGLLLIVLRRRLTLPAVVAGCAALGIGAEIVATILQAHSGILADTTILHVAGLGYVLVGLGGEIVARRRLHAEAARERDRMRAILDRVIADNFDGVVVLDQSSTILAASDLAERLLGQGRNIVGLSSAGVLPPEIQAAADRVLSERRGLSGLAEARCRLGPEERVLEYAITLSSLQDDEAGQGRHVACLTFQDITERRRSEERLAFLAHHDPLTGALSRARFVELVAAQLAAAPAAGVTVLLLDLSRFRVVNESLGHAYGDLALRETFARISATPSLALARVGGDSFAFAFPSLLDAQAVASLSAALSAAIAEPFQLGEHRAVLGARIGVTNSAVSGRNADLLLRHADMALSAASTAGGEIHAWFQPEMEARLSGKREMEIALRLALAEQQFSVVYQPLVALEGRALVGAEALLRWRHPTLGNVSPALFIPAAEETGLIVELGRWVLETACRQAAAWPAHVRMAVNVSPVQFELGDVVGDVERALAMSGLAPARLDVEITEGVFVDRGDRVSQALEALRGLGCGVAIDDFGTGYSSLSYLGRLPVDKLKIDQSFVRTLPDDAEGSAIVQAILTLSQSLGKTVVAEGIETDAQAEFLRRSHCAIGQGYLFSRPVPSAEFERVFFPSPALAG